MNQAANPYDQATQCNPLADLADQFGFYIADNDGRSCLVMNDEIGAEHHGRDPDSWATYIVRYYDLPAIDQAARYCWKRLAAVPSYADSIPREDIAAAYKAAFGHYPSFSGHVDPKANPRVALMLRHIMNAAAEGGFNSEYL